MNIDSIHYIDLVRAIALKLPETAAAISYGTPSFKVKDKLFTRIKEDGKTLVVYTNEREKWMKTKPATFFITDHYKNYPMMLIDLASVGQAQLKLLITSSWKLRASKTILKNNPSRRV